MKYPYIVNCNGVWYPAGTEVPEETPLEETKEEPKVEVKESKHVTKKEIASMNVKKLRELATENGIENPEEYTGAELKKMLTEKIA